MATPEKAKTDQGGNQVNAGDQLLKEAGAGKPGADGKNEADGQGSNGDDPNPSKSLTNLDQGGNQVNAGDQEKEAANSNGPTEKVPGEDIINQGQSPEDQKKQWEAERLEREQEQERDRKENEADKKDFIDSLAGAVADKLKDANIQPGKTEAEPVSDHEAKLKKFGPGYVDAVKGGHQTTYTALAWENLGKDKSGWSKKVVKPAELQ